MILGKKLENYGKHFSKKPSLWVEDPNLVILNINKKP
jgi:hypothetical protein